MRKLVFTIMSMHRFQRRERAQSVAEYSLLFTAVAAILLVVILGPFNEGVSVAFTNLVDSVQTSLNGFSGE